MNTFSSSTWYLEVSVQFGISAALTGSYLTIKVFRPDILGDSFWLSKDFFQILSVLKIPIKKRDSW